MPSRITTLCGNTGQRAPRHAGEFTRAILVSLACKYNLVLARLRASTGRAIDDEDREEERQIHDRVREDSLRPAHSRDGERDQ